MGRYETAPNALPLPQLANVLQVLATTAVGLLDRVGGRRWKLSSEWTRAVHNVLQSIINYFRIGLLIIGGSHDVSPEVRL